MGECLAWAVSHLLLPLGVPAPAGHTAHHLCHPWGLLFNVQPTLSIIAKKKKKTLETTQKPVNW